MWHSTPGMRIRALVLKIHVYAGLLTFAQLSIYGAAGIAAALQHGIERPKVARVVRHVPFTPPASATDKQVAAAVYELLAPPLARPMPDWFLRRTPENDLRLDFYNINGIWRVVVLEREQRLRIEEIRNGLGYFLSDVHAATPGDAGAPRLVRLWAIYNEAAMWCLLGFCGSGAYLWLSAPGRGRWAWACLAVGTSVFAALWASFR